MSEVKKIIEEKIAGKLRDKPEIAKGIGAAVAIDLSGEDGGRWLIDMSKDPATVGMSTGPAATTISMDAKIFEQMANGELDPQTAFLTGKVKVDGNLGVAIKLGQLFG